MSGNFNAFLSPNFVLKDWINSSLSSDNSSRILKQRNSDDTASEISALSNDSEESKLTEGEPLNTTLEKQAFMYVTRLQLLSHELNKRLETTCESVTKNLPRIIYDLEIIKQEAVSAKGKIANINQELANVVQKEDNTLYDLVKLELIKSRMEASKNVLREAETWNNLGAEVSSLMAKKAYLDVTSRLEEAQNSLAMFQDSHEYEERLKLLENLKTQLEHALQPLLSTAIDGRETKDCKDLYGIFSRINKEEVFLETYFHHRTASLSKQWEDSFAERPDGSNLSAAKISSANLGDFLPKFFEEVFIVLNQEKGWCTEIFPKPGSVIYALICSLFRSLRPSFPSQVDLLVGQRPMTDSLPELIRAFKASEKFGSNVERLLNQLYEQNQGNLTTDLSHWGDSIFEGFLAHQCKYPEYESSYLEITLDKLLKFDSVKETGDSLIRSMLDVVAKAFNVFNASLSRCLYLTHGFASVGMTKAVSEHICKLITRLSNYCAQLSSLFNDENSVTLPQITEDEEADGDEYREVNWQLFQLGLELIGVCQRLAAQITELENNARKAVLFTENLTREELAFGKGADHLIVVNETNPTDFTIPTQDITVTSLMLLKESTLNSLELRSLLETVKSKPFCLFEKPNAASKKLTEQCQRYLFNILYVMIKRQFVDFQKNPSWTSNESGTTSPLRLQIPKFSLSPSIYITRIGEYLLTLPQQLETYSGHDSFGFSLDTLPFSQSITPETTPPASTNTSSPKLSPDKPSPRSRTAGERSSPPGLNRARSYSTVSSDHSSNAHTPRLRRSSSVSGSRPRLLSLNSSDQIHETNRRIEITHRWINSVAQVTQSKLCEMILGLERISPFGAKQLATDIEYFTNILLAIDITPGHRLLGIFKGLEWSPETLGQLTQSAQPQAEMSDEDRKLLAQEGTMEVLQKVRRIRE
ncbi:hypothetical protein K493DRAFT_319709 [Basidiobolus meristosporus CBS 931.73]|uniref:Conserved oligomeric Golgi complex subunit 7 n=1 Tax=Basidiobolus meristosporus CBS 931.73 TaxID=1314790 RepID=A0A1Y1XN83_9FUNG|nr:hypothetical protein K493DRAFT_319709 [Basidiobolus meristosporus CBS 931.73]|eukprot:ORX87183.1 hypothetical protein K493DRAFT_319709 [Basidiobolus meristosporus CBS 931.73]